MPGNLSADNHEVFSGQHVHPNIVCKSCIFQYGKPPFEDDPEKGYCKIYSRSRGYLKPNSVYFDGKPCRFHMTKEELLKKLNGKKIR